MNREPCLLSVVVPTYNRRRELETMLDSLLPQVEGKPVEVLIADDRSTDDTWEWLTSRFKDSQNIQIFRAEANGGPGPARNLCLSAATGRYFTPIDSDFIVTAGAIDAILATIDGIGDKYELFFFPCLQYPAMKRLDELQGSCLIDYESFVTDQAGEVVAVASIGWMRSRAVAYPPFRAGGETLLWAKYLAEGPALFVDFPIVLYRTDVAQRICTLEYQMSHPADLAAIADAMAEMMAPHRTPALKSTRARKCLAAGIYHLLAGNERAGRSRLLRAISMRSWPAAAALVASLGGRGLFRGLFRIYRTRFSRAYL
jgi:hypothetical protein